MTTDPNPSLIPNRETPMLRQLKWGLLAVLIIGVAYGGWQLYAGLRFSARRPISKTNLKQIGQALHQYHDKYNSFPPAYVLGPDEKPWHSWRVLLLPFLGEAELYAKYRFDEPWDGAHNRELQTLRPDVYRSGFSTSQTPSVTTYVGVVSRRSMWPAYFPVRITDVTDGTSNTIQLIENTCSDVIWSEPRDLRERDALAMLKTGKTLGTDRNEGFSILLADGSSRFVSRRINRQLLIGLLTPRAGEMTVSDDRWPEGLLRNESPTKAKLPGVAPLDRFPGTRLLVIPEVALVPDQTSLYSATVQIAWDRLRPEGGGLVTDRKDSALITALDAHPFPLTSLAEDAYIAGVSGLDDSRELFSKVRQKFPDAPPPIRDPDLQGDGLRIWVHMQKSMPFPDVMQQFPEPLTFSAHELQPVQSFGWPSSTGEGGAFPVLNQTVSIRDYVSDEDFIIVLQTDSAQSDEIILSKMTPGNTLQAKWGDVSARMRQPKGHKSLEHLRGIDQLQIPILSFGLTGVLSELTSLKIPSKGYPDRFIAIAEQTLQFRLDEYGAELIADTQMMVGENGHGPSLDIKPLKPRRLVFNKPFLLALRERGAEVPYFLAWIGNADLMEPAK